MDEKPRTLRSMLARAKDLSELMADLAYAALYFNSLDMAGEIEDLETQMSELVLEMRAVCVIAERNPKNARGMSSVLQVISAIERVANDAVDISRIVTNNLGIPAELVEVLSSADEVCHRVEIAESSALANRTIASLELPVVSGTRISAIRRDKEWITDVTDEMSLVARDVLILVGPQEGIERLRELAGIPPMDTSKKTISPGKTPDVARAADLLVEMKDVSGISVDLAYSALALGDKVLAAEVNHLEAILDDMREQLELWVLQAAAAGGNPEELRGLLHLATAAEDIGDQANQMVWTVEKGETHPILGIAIGDSTDVAVRYPVREGSQAVEGSLQDLELTVEPGFMILAIYRNERYIHRPSAWMHLQAGDEVIAVGPNAGREALGELFGWILERDEETGEEELLPLESGVK